MTNGQKVKIDIVLTGDGRIGIASTSDNLVTNLGLLETAKAFFQRGMRQDTTPEIIIPKVELR